MKPILVSVAVIICLVACFFLLDRRDFNRYGESQNVQTENTVFNNRKSATVSKSEQKPVAVPPVMPEGNNATTTTPASETQSAKPNPASETVPSAEAKPAAETKTISTETEKEETKPVSETKPVTGTTLTETKPVADTIVETKPDNKPAPAAVPVATPEEAEKANEFALFLSTVKTTVVEGEITERSELPDPKASDYPDCRFTAHFMGNAIKSGEPCPKEIGLIVEGFNDYEVQNTDELNPGDKIRCTIIPFEKLSEEYKSTQLADDLNMFLLENYYVLDLDKITDYTDNEFMPASGIYFSEGNEAYISIFERHINPPVPESVIEAQKAAIQHDLDKMNNLFAGWDDAKTKEINTRFADVWEKEKAKDPPNYNRVQDGKYVWRNIHDSFWCLPTDTKTLVPNNRMLTPETIDCFVGLKKALETNGVQLIVTIVPSLFDISSRVINNEFVDIPDLRTATYVKQLSEIGIETIYASDKIIQNYNRFPFAFFYPDNAHPADTAQDVITDILADRLKRYDIDPKLDPALFTEKQNQRHFLAGSKEYYWPANCDISSNEPGTPRSCRQIVYNNEQMTQGNDAPVIIFGNSFIVSPMSDYAYGYESAPSLISYKTLSRVDWRKYNYLGVFQEGLKQLLSDPVSMLLGKKVFIMFCGIDHLDSVDSQNLMVNLFSVDNNRKKLNNKALKHKQTPSSNITTQIEINTQNQKIINDLQNKVLFSIEANGETIIEKIDLRNEMYNNIDKSKKVTLVIPAVCSRNTSCNLFANDNMSIILSYNTAISFHYIIFEIPAGTNEITIKAEGKPGTIFAINDIQIWQ